MSDRTAPTTTGGPIDSAGALRERGAADLAHPGGDLLSHLERTAERLRSWGAAPELVTAGQWHAAYATEGFPTALFQLHERPVVAATIGEHAEAIVYRYCSCDRRFVYGRIGGSKPVEFLDRFTGMLEAVDEPGDRAFAELTVANELDVMVHSDSFRRERGPQLIARFETWSAVLSPAACDAVRDILDPGPSE